MTLNNGTLNASGWVIIGESDNGQTGSQGTMVQNGGTFNAASSDGGGRFWIGTQEGGAAGASSGGSLTYGGILNVSLLGGTLIKGDTFNLFDATSFGGSFSSVNLPATAGTDYWENKLSLDGTITFIPEPSSALLGTAALLAMVSRRRRK